MKRVALGILAMVGVLSVAIGLLAADTYWRATRALEAEDARFRADLEAWRSRRPPDLRPMLIFEKGHEGLFMRPPQPAEPTTLDGLVGSLYGRENDTEEAGYFGHEARRSRDCRSLNALREALRQPLEPAEVRQVLDALDRLIPRRTAMPDLVEGEHLLDRADLLAVAAGRSDGKPILVDGPGWKELWSWKILVVKSLRQIEERKQELMKLESASLADWEDAARAYGLRVRHEEAFTRSRVCSDAAKAMETERQCRLHWAFTRAAARIALHRAEHRRLPATLEELGDMPPSPYDGATYLWLDGRLLTWPGSIGPSLEWDSKR